MATPTFVAATQKWVMNRIQEVKNYVQDVKSSIIDVITNLANIHDRDMKTVGMKFSQLADEIVTGKMTVDGDVVVGNSLNVNAGVRASGIASSAPIVCTDPAGLLLTTPGRAPTGLNSTTLSIVNERGKMARFFMRGDRLYYDYEYDKIYTYFEESTGAKLRYLKRGSSPFVQLVNGIEHAGTDIERLNALEEWFNKPDQYHGHPESRLFNCTVRECFPALGTPFMIPESILFTVPEAWKLRKIKLVNAEGQAVKVLKDFGNRDIKRLLINFPYVRSMMEDGQEVPFYGATARTDGAMVAESITEAPVGIQHIGDFHNGYYEVTDPDARFHEALDSGLVPNVILRLNEFPKDKISVIYFDVVHA